YDAGAIDAGSGDAGPCDPIAETGCGQGEKCTYDGLDDGGAVTLCGQAGPHMAYDTACLSDGAPNDGLCYPGTACVTLDYGTQFQQGYACSPFCDPTLFFDLDGGFWLPDAGMAYPDGGQPDDSLNTCGAGGVCLFPCGSGADDCVNRALEHIGFCDRPAGG